MKTLFTRFVHETEGQDLIEYALLAATIAIGVTLAMQGVRGALQTRFNAISTNRQVTKPYQARVTHQGLRLEPAASPAARPNNRHSSVSALA